MKGLLRTALCLSIAWGVAQIPLTLSLAQEANQEIAPAVNATMPVDVSVPVEPVAPVTGVEEGAGEEDLAVNEVSGKISAIDASKGTIVVKQLKDEQAQAFEDVEFLLQNTTSIQKDYKTAAVADIVVGDDVTVEYTTDDKGVKLATYVWVEKLE